MAALPLSARPSIVRPSLSLACGSMPEKSAHPVSRTVSAQAATQAASTPAREVAIEVAIKVVIGDTGVRAVDDGAASNFGGKVKPGRRMVKPRIVVLVAALMLFGEG